MQTSKENSRISPDFANPPVVETALGIQFQEIEGFKTPHFGLFYEEVRDRYPVIEEQQRLEPITERFPKALAIPGLKFASTIKPQRVFFKDTEGSALIQVQPDRFGFNWKKPDHDDAAYPRYSGNCHRCLDEFEGFVAFVNRLELGEIQPNLCEVVYINHIWPTEGESVIDLFASVFRGLEWEANPLLGTPEVATINRRYVIGENKGRLYAEASVAHRKGMGDFIQLRMIGRALHNEEKTVVETLDLAHQWVVQGFVELTEPGIRATRWGQI